MTMLTIEKTNNYKKTNRDEKKRLHSTHGLALALEDVSSSHLSWTNASGTNGGKTAIELCSEWNTSKAVTGASWMLPSMAQWNTMINTAGDRSTLRQGFTSVGGTNMSSNLYWSSSEYEHPSTNDYAWAYSFNDEDTRDWFWEYKGQAKC